MLQGENLLQTYPGGTPINLLLNEYRKIPEIPEGDELGVAYPRSYFCRTRYYENSRYSAEDAMNSNSIVGFQPCSEHELNEQISSLIYREGLIMPRRTKIDKSDDLVKMVCCIFLVTPGGKMLLLPRYGKDILPDVFTIPLMESIKFQDIQNAYKCAFGLCHCSFDYMSFWKQIISRTVSEECPELGDSLSTPFLIGTVGGGKDEGIVFGYEVEEDLLQTLSRLKNGIIFNSWRTSYQEVVNYWGGRVDGWTSSIMLWNARFSGQGRNMIEIYL